MTMPNKVNLKHAFAKIPDAWNPRVAGNLESERTRRTLERLD